MRILTLLLALSYFSANAQKAYLKFIDPEIPGNLKEGNFTNYFELSSVKYNMSKINNKASTGVMEVVHENSVESPNIWSNFLNTDKPIKFEIVFTSLPPERIFLSYKLDRAYINAMNLGSENLTHVSIWIGAFAYKYFEYNQSGQLIGTKSVGWDFLDNVIKTF